MPPTTTIASNPPPPPRLPPSPIVDPVQRSPVQRSPIQRSPVLSPKITEPRQQRSGSLHPSSPPQRPSTPPQPSLDQRAENGSKKPEPIDLDTFNQILELDEDGFAWEMVEAYMEQVEGTFVEMEVAIDNKDHKTLSSLGHFLKGSSATLGVVGVRNSCELIQHYGDLREPTPGKHLTPEDALTKISAALEEAKEKYEEAKAWLNAWHVESQDPKPNKDVDE